MNLPKFFQIADEVAQSLTEGRPVVALESTVISHGLPYPDNLKLAEDMEVEVRACGATPATIALYEGQVVVGAQRAQLERLARGGDVHKISSRDIGPAVARGWSGGTTVAGTLATARLAGIKVFATGGIGGVHRQAPFDISADLPQLARTPMVVVCAGAKAILDLPATIEYLETAGVPVVGYETDDFPAFYSQKSGLKSSVRADSAEEIAKIARSHWALGFESAVLVGNPPPESMALNGPEIEEAIEAALKAAFEHNVHGQAVTPFLLERVSQLTSGASKQTNLALLLNNARLAAAVAVAFTQMIV